LTAGVAICSEGDTYSKEYGRGLALNRALDAVGVLLSWDDAEAIASAYAATRPQVVARAQRPAPRKWTPEEIAEARLMARELKEERARAPR